MNRLTLIPVVALTSIVLSIAVGCGSSKPAKFYVLHTPAELGDAPADSGLVLTVGPIVIPGHLDRPQVTTIQNSSELSLSEFHRWGGPLRENIQGTLTDNLSILLGTSKIVQYPVGESMAADFRVAVRITHFEGTLGDEAMLRARWLVYGNDGKKELFARSTEYSLPLTQDSYREYVNVQSLLLADLSRDIAKAIGELAGK